MPLLSPTGQGRRGTATSIDDTIWTLMQGRSWQDKPECPSRDELKLLSIPFVNLSGNEEIGEMVVAASVADDVISLFADIYAASFPMDANNSSAFNCREIVGGTGLSEHSFGTAIDINPVQNPYVFDNNILPAAGEPYAVPSARVASVPGMIVADGPVVTAFKKIGWRWGGEWDSKKDYHHFSKSGR